MEDEEALREMAGYVPHGGLRDFVILCIATLVSVLALVQLGFFIPAAITLCVGFLTIRMDDTAVLDFMQYAARYFLSTQQYFEWR